MNGPMVKLQTCCNGLAHESFYNIVIVCDDGGIVYTSSLEIDIGSCEGPDVIGEAPVLNTIIEEHTINLKDKDDYFIEKYNDYFEINEYVKIDAAFIGKLTDNPKQIVNLIDELSDYNRLDCKHEKLHLFVKDV